MRGKMWFFGGVAVGFVVGARAGRERYDQLVAATRRMMDHPTVQEAAGVVQEQANRLYVESKDTVSKKLSHSKLGERMSRNDSEGATNGAAGESLASTGRKRSTGTASGTTAGTASSTT